MEDKSTTSSASSMPTTLTPTPTPSVLTLTIPDEATGTSATAATGRTRATSPSLLPAELILKAKNAAHMTSLDEVRLLSSHVEDLHQAFIREHAYFEITWPVKCLDHEYFKSELVTKERQLHLKLKLRLNRLREDVAATAQSKVVVSPAPSSRASKLPEIALPTFSGSYVDWPAYSELFTSLIINDKQLMDIDRLHYLRSSVTGEPARHVNAYPLTGASFQACWEYLAKRFSNKRVLIQEQLNKLFNLPSIQTRSSTALDNLRSSITEVTKTLKALDAAEDMLNCVLIHLATNCLDKHTREAWETSVGSANEYPRYEQLESFIDNKIVALEQLEGAAQKQAQQRKAQPPSSAPSRPSHRSATSNAATHSQTSSKFFLSANNYPCDCCQGPHFVVMCPEFREMSVEARRKLITRYELCRNCCGRHNTEVCKSLFKCETCGARHHTMLHLKGSTTQPAQTSAPAQSTSQSSAQ